ncbi:MAG: hypothetical protein EHM16_00165 [Betaproteobacteria bacterium]|nr:MAG: hypothetical protein EHM16_00165 [Betaproteobacteria bacterium]
MGALGHYLEREGVATAQISLIREQTAAIKPPRALWVPFMLGRPLGSADDPDFQRRVLRTLLSLFEHATGPVLEDYPEDAPAAGDRAQDFACPVSFTPGASTRGGLARALRDEIAQLAAWYELARIRRGRTTMGVFGPTVDDAVQHVTAFLDGHPEPTSGIRAGTAIKRACDDIRTYYFEAAAAQPGALAPKAVERWFWNETAAAQALLAIRERCMRSNDESLKPLATLGLIPRAVLDRYQRNS